MTTTPDPTHTAYDALCDAMQWSRMSPAVARHYARHPEQWRARMLGGAAYARANGAVERAPRELEALERLARGGKGEGKG